MTEPAEVTRIPIKTLTKMMVAGQNQVVMKYLRTLPSEECAEVREQLIKNLELIQQQQRKASSTSKPSDTSSKSTDKSAGSDSKSTRDKPSSGASGSGTARRTNKTTTPSSKEATSKLTITNAQDEDKDAEKSGPVERPQVGNYVFSKDLGKGQFGVVYKATHITSGLRVAIKEIDTDQVSAASLPGIMKEAEVMAGLDHVNILKIFEVIKGKKRIYFILDYINRGSLLQLIKAVGVFTDEVAAYFVKQSCEGLKYLHESHSIIHRDIKCANLLLTHEGVIKLADFGTAKEDAGKSFTVIGTPFWMAPEIIEVAGAHVVSDIWSMGCTLVEMLRGTPPYFELATMQALFKIVEDPHPPIPTNFSDDVKGILKNFCFVKDVKKRATAAVLLKQPWVNKFDNRLLNYDQLVAMIRKEDPSNVSSTKKKSSTNSKTTTNATATKSSSRPDVSESASNTSLTTQITGLQLEIEKLSLEQARLQKELNALLGNQ